MAATQKQNIAVYKGAPTTLPKLMAASQGIFIAGSPFYQSSAGTMKLSDTSDGTGDAYNHIARRGAGTAALALNAAVDMDVITEAIWYAIYLETSGTDAAATQAMVGDQYGVVVSATAGEVGYTSVDSGEATNVAVVVKDIMSNVDGSLVTTSTNPGIVLVSFLAAVINVVRA